MNKVIALTGPKGSGKDTVGQMIADQLAAEYDVSLIAFADPIKSVIQRLFDLDPINNDQYDLFKRTTLHYQLPGYINHSVSAREVVRELGMLMRSYDEKQFVDYVRTKIEQCPNRVWVVTDMRFDNEYMMLKNIGAQIVKITRPNYTYDGHITERGFDDHLVDHTLLNDNSLEYLSTRVGVLIERFKERW